MQSQVKIVKQGPNICSFTDFTSQTYLTVIRILHDSEHRVVIVIACGLIVKIIDHRPKTFSVEVPEYLFRG